MSALFPHLGFSRAVYNFSFNFFFYHSLVFIEDNFNVSRSRYALYLEDYTMIRDSVVSLVMSIVGGIAHAQEWDFGVAKIRFCFVTSERNGAILENDRPLS